jgi:hypothetical protein
MAKIEEVSRRILRYGTDDWVALHALLGEAREETAEEPDSFKGLVIAVLDNLLAEGLVEVGTLGEAGFAAFRGTSAEIVAIVVARCDETGWRQGGEDNIWLSNTKKGDGLA